MPRAKSQPFVVSRVDVNYDFQPWAVVVHGQIRIKNSPQGNSRNIFARLTLAEAEHLEFQLHASILQVRNQK